MPEFQNHDDIPEDRPEFEQRIKMVKELLQKGDRQSLIDATTILREPLFTDYYDFTKRELVEQENRINYLGKMRKILHLEDLFAPESLHFELTLRIFLSKLLAQDLSSFEIKDTPLQVAYLKLLAQGESDGDSLSIIYFQDQIVQLIPQTKIKEIIQQVLSALSEHQRNFLKNTLAFVQELKSN